MVILIDTTHELVVKPDPDRFRKWHINSRSIFLSMRNGCLQVWLAVGGQDGDSFCVLPQRHQHVSILPVLSIPMTAYSRLYLYLQIAFTGCIICTTSVYFILKQIAKALALVSDGFP